MNNQDIMNEIKSKLTGNKIQDEKYLKEQLAKYKKENNNQVTFFISQILFSYLDENERKKYDNFAKEVLIKRKEQYLNALNLIKNSKLEQAKLILLELLSSYDKMRHVESALYFDFEQMIEYIIYCKTFNNSVKLNIHRFPEPVTNFCYQLAAISIEQGLENDAINYLNKALSFNPRGMYLYEELIKLYLKKAMYNEAFTLTKEALRFAYKKEQFAFLYQAAGMFFKNQQNYPMSIASFVVSDYFAGESFNKKEISEIVKIAGFIKFETPEKIIELFKTEDINYGPSKELIETVNDFSNYFTQTKNYKSLNYLLQIMIDLTESTYYINKQKEIEEFINEKK